jgi:hypothetical protein
MSEDTRVLGASICQLKEQARNRWTGSEHAARCDLKANTHMQRERGAFKVLLVLWLDNEGVGAKILCR